MRYLKLIIWIIIIGILCFTPGDDLKEVKINIPHFDKIVHFGMFYILSLFIRGILKLDAKQQIRWVVFAVVYAGLIEIIQYYFIPLRNGDWVDLLADLIGLTIGWFSFTMYPKFMQRIFIAKK